MRSYRRGFGAVTALGFLALLAWSSVSAQERALTLMGGYQFGGEFEDEVTGDVVELDEAANYTVLFNLPYEQNTEFEFLVSRQSTSLQDAGDFTGEERFDLDVYYFHVGGTYIVDAERVEPYVAGTVGLTHMSPDPSGLDTETALSLSLGGGVRVPLGERFALRFDLRGFVTSLDGGGSIFCGNGACNVRIASTGFLQYAASAGFVIKF